MTKTRVIKGRWGNAEVAILGIVRLCNESNAENTFPCWLSHTQETP
jgi:hypothetical protein